MRPFTITTCQHRGRLCLRTYVNGKPRYRVVQNPDRIEHERQAWLLELLNDAANPTPKAKRKTLDEVIDEWLEYTKTKGTEQHVYQCEFRVRRIIAVAGITQLDQIDAPTVEVAVDNLHRRPQHPEKQETDERPISLNTKNHYKAAIKSLINYAIDKKYLTGNPLKKLTCKLVKDESQMRHPRDRFQPDELTKLIETAEASKYEVEAIIGTDRAMLYRLAAATGLRKKELAALRPSSFSLGRKPEVQLGAMHTKNGEPVTQPIQDDLVPLLQRWLPTIKGDRLLFPDFANKDAAKMVAWDCEAAGIPIRTTRGRRTFHSLRNSFISALAETCPLPLTQKLARHSTPELTDRYYRTATDAERSAVNKLPSLGQKPKLFKPDDGDEHVA